MERLHMLGGLPRSGSTLLSNLLCQNPDIHATHTSGMMDVMFGVRNQWNNLIEHKAHPNQDAQRRVLAAIPQAYYADVEKPIVIDKCRGWTSLIEMAEFAFEEKIKIIVPVRNMLDILSSLEKLWRKQAATGQIPGESENYAQMQSTQGRCEYWLRTDQVIGLAFNRIQNALLRGLSDRMHFVPFEELTSHPGATMEGIYRFLGEEPFTHDFNNVEQVTEEDDGVHGFGPNLHKIRPRIEVIQSDAKDILGEKLVEQYEKIKL